MDPIIRRNVVISAVNLRKGGTLTVLRDCLRYLSDRKDLHVTALVHRQDLCDYPGIEYIEIPWSIGSWLKRLKCEYITMDRISRKLPETDLWLSLHDTSPRVKAKRQAVYCHTPFPFMKARARDRAHDGPGLGRSHRAAPGRSQSRRRSVRRLFRRASRNARRIPRFSSARVGIVQRMPRRLLQSDPAVLPFASLPRVRSERTCDCAHTYARDAS